MKNILSAISLSLWLICCQIPHAFAQQIIRTIAGSGAPAFSGDRGPAILAGLGMVYGVQINDSGYVFTCDNNANNIRIISPAGMIRTYAGDTAFMGGFTGDGGSATGARFNSPFSITLDSMGNLYVADAGNKVIRKIDTDDSISTIAGLHGALGYYNGDGIAALAANIGYPAATAFDSHGNLYIADGNTRVRKINTAGIISTVAGNGNVGYAGNGGPATNAVIEGVAGVCVDNAGNIYIAEKINDVVRKVNATTGIISLFAGNHSNGFSGDGGQATSAKLNGPNAVKIDPQGNVVIVDQNNNRVRKVNITTGIITTIAGSTGTGGFAGDGGPATSAIFGFPSDVCWDRFGNMFIADKGQGTTSNGHRIREVFNIDTMHLTTYPNDTVCGYAHITYTAHEMKGKHYLSFYKWKLNGSSVGSNSPTYYTDSVHNGDVITCSLIDTANGGFTIAVSDTVKMVVRPVVVPSLTLTSTGDTLCAGQLVTITAHGVNAGTAPVYKWYKYGALVGTGATYSYTPAVGDIITCVLVSNAVCAEPDTVSASKAMVVNVSYPPTVTLDPHPNTTVAFWGQIITLFTELTYEGSHPTFQWYRNGHPIPGATSQTYFETVYTDDTLYCVMYSNAPCVVPDHDTSNIMYISIGNLIVSNTTQQKAVINITPNPNNGSFTISGILGNDNTVQITITDMLGKAVYQEEALPANGKIDIKINAGKQLPSGIYLLNVRSDGGSQVVHFVVK